MRQKLFMIAAVAAVFLLFGAVGIGVAGLSDSTTAVSIGSVGDDVSGPCDEAEHADDPECVGQPGDDDDSSGPGPGGDDQAEDNSGPSENAGPGNAHDEDPDGDDHGGHGGDDSSGSGHDGAEDDHGGSGPG